MNIDKEFVPYQQSLDMKSIEFDEPCFGRFNNEGDLVIAHTEKYIISNGVDRSKFFTLAPLYQQAFRWFREKYGLHVNKTGNNYFTSFNMTESKIEVLSFVRYTDTENHYEEAEFACLKQLIEITKKK
jgi:hypothetical protein